MQVHKKIIPLDTKKISMLLSTVSRPTTNDFYFKRIKYACLNAAKGKTYIYILFTAGNTNLKAQPFYVGKTKELETRFAHHKEAIWHSSKYPNRAKLFVIAELLDKYAGEAEGELIKELSANGLLLNNDKYNGGNRKYKTLTPQEEYDYLRKGSNAVDIIKKWQFKYLNISSNEESVTHDKLHAQGLLGSSDIKKAIKEKPYVSRAGKKLSYDLADNYIPQTNEASIIFYKNKDLTIRENEENLLDAIQDLGGDWVLASNLDFNIPVKFRLDNTLKELAAFYAQYQKHLFNFFQSRKFKIDGVKAVHDAIVEKFDSTLGYVEQEISASAKRDLHNDRIKREVKKHWIFTDRNTIKPSEELVEALIAIRA